MENIASSETAALDERKERILRQIVECYVRDGEPVGSKAVAEGADLGVSSATIRNEMAILEREGYISHPHTSAGRIPTDKGYRYYVDQLAPKPIGAPKRREIEQSLAGAFSALDDLLARTSQLLSELTDYTSLASSPSSSEQRVRRVEVVRLGGPRLLLVCVGDEGWHDDRLIELPQEPTDDEVAQVVRIANSVIDQSTPQEAARAVGEVVAAPEVEALLRALSQGLDAVAQRTGRLYTTGTSKLVVWEPSDTARRVLDILETGQVELLPMPAAGAVSVRIGRELPLDDLRDLSLISTGYRFGQTAGALGILGPTRMDYPTVIATVAEVAASLSRVLRQLG